MPAQNPESLLDAIVNGLARGFARYPETHDDTALHGAGLWIMLDKNRFNPDQMVMSYEGFKKFIELREAIGSRAVVYASVDRQG